MKTTTSIRRHLKNLINNLKYEANEAQYRTQLESIEIYRSNIDRAKRMYLKRAI